MKKKKLFLSICIALAIPLAAVPLQAAIKVSNSYGSSFDYGSVVSLGTYRPAYTNPNNSSNKPSTENSNTAENTNPNPKTNTPTTPNKPGSVNINSNKNSSGYSNSVSLKNHKVNTKPTTPTKQPTQPAPTQPAPTQPAPTQPAPTQPKPSIPVTGSATLSAQEQTMVNEINKERAAAGLAPLQVSLPLVEVAQLKANDMKTNGYFSHTSPTYGSPFDMLRSAGISYRGAGENIAINSSVDGAMAAFMSSDGHRRNILNPAYTHVGIGVVKSSHGTYFVQIFATL